MAKFEEADPRWKVKDLGTQGANVNNWHWTENDCFPYFKERFTSSFDGNTILSGVEAGDLSGELSCWKLEKITGEASITKRKGKKVIVIYELEVDIKWEAILKNAAGETASSSKGSYKMPCIDTVEDIDAFEIQVKFNKEAKEHKSANDFAKKQGQAKVREMIVAIIEQLKAEAGAKEAAGTPIAGGGVSGDTIASGANQAPSEEKAKAKAKPAAPERALCAGDAGHYTIHLESEFNCPAKELFECFTEVRKVMAFTQSKAQVSTDAGAAFSLFDGSITGKVVSCEMNEKLVWEWRQSSWAAGTFSLCTLTFKEDAPGCTMLVLEQTAIPKTDGHGNDTLGVEQGWKINFFDRIKMVFGYGSPQFS